MLVEKNNEFSVECQTKISKDCIKSTEFFDTKEEVFQWVENECWIDSGDGWICNQCHDQLMGSLKKHRKSQGKGIDGLNHDVEGFDGLDNDLEKGIDIVR